MARHQYFIEKTKDTFNADVLMVPETPLYFRNDHKRVAWLFGATPYGRTLKFFCVKFARRDAIVDEFTIEGFGTIEPGTALGQLWFAPVYTGISPEGQALSTNVIYYTLLKNFQSHDCGFLKNSGPLSNFEQRMVLAQSQGYDFRELVWMATFRESSTWKYVLDFDYAEPDEAMLPQRDRVVAVLERKEDMERLSDPALETVTQLSEQSSEFG